jgi:protein tyrosine/serine phosphatase
MRPTAHASLRSGSFLAVATLLAQLTVTLFAALAGAATITAEQAGVPNFGQVNENYFRGGQPDEAGFARLGKLGIKTVIDLQESPRGDEPGCVKSAGMRYVCIPLSSSHPATGDQTKQFLTLVNDPANWPVYVHCAGGRHRTGEMTGIFRITHDTWTADQAFAEMQKYGYYSFPNHGSLKGYVYRYYDQYKPRAAGKPATPPASLAAADSSATAAAPAVATP